MQQHHVVVAILFRYFNMTITISTWNVNSIRTRLETVIQWLREHQPTVLLLQEIKCMTELFPEEAFSDLGYNCAVIGQKSYNGVALLSKDPIDDVQTALPNFDDTHARYIEAFTGNVRVASVYVPNGREVGSEHYRYKLAFYAALQRHMSQLLALDESVVIGGDFNVAPYAMDMHNPVLSGTDRILCAQGEQDALRSLINTGYTDAVRSLHPYAQGLFTWWDYRAGAFDQNRGYRIDHLLLSPQAADRLVSAEISSTVRGLQRASDHAPVMCTLR